METKMILIDALYINNGGGKILLDYLILKLNESSINVHFLLDERVRGKHSEINSSKVEYLEGNFLKRHSFYLKNRNKFSKVLCFGNLPPNVKINALVFTYFHNPMYLDIPKEFSVLEHLKFNLKVLVLKCISKNTNYWIVQSDFIKNKLQSKFNFKSNQVKILPFYPEFEKLDLKILRESNTYIYVSNANPHKNHERLISVFCDFYDQYKLGKLILTVNDSYPLVLKLIEEKVKHNYPIENIGFVDRLTLYKKYLSSEFLIFPSLTESFGLGLIESIECGCKVICSNLQYSYEVCEPTLTFDPIDNKSIFNALERSLNKDKLHPSIPQIKNNIHEIIDLLK
ncbi:glycosyltransferase [Flavobacterium sp. P21]|uniref:glycosyltransferase n=1 Tax=Flavobacterium sp. P21 TaxID=3423948 RepID=UPI003D663E0C